MVVLGIMAIYAASVGTDGVLYGGQGHMQPLMLVVFLVLLGEAWVLLSASMEPLVVKNELHMMWKKTFYDNRRRLSWLESYYGCCGFKNSTDMPSSEKCSMLSGSLAQKPRGCMELMRQDVFHNNKLALEWKKAAFRGTRHLQRSSTAKLLKTTYVLKPALMPVVSLILPEMIKARFQGQGQGQSLNQSLSQDQSRM
ncbi:hypothetical protein LPJ75_001415 [Coemansia sp. RSA 2598]|nr:hypothetical protein LPJ75_001415 [Coemansia sp. RSA 2598]